MTETSQLEYASFWRRLGAYMIDSVIVDPLEKLLLFASCNVFAPIILMFVVLAMSAVFFMYRPVCHANWGRTIGKRCMRLRVTQRDSTLPSWFQALLRELFFVPGTLLGMIAIVLALQHSAEIGSYANFKSVVAPFYHEQGSLFFQVITIYIIAINALQVSFVVLHPQHRALHDLVAGTVVLHESKPPKGGRMPLEDISCLQCGAGVPKEENACPACGWTY